MENAMPPGDRKRFPGRGQLPFVTCLAAIFALSLWIRSAFPITALGDAIHDDLLFLELAEHLGKFRWLGPYDEFTMAKGAFYSFFILVSHALHIPLKMAEQAFYLGAALFFSLTAGRIWGSRWGAVACFAVLSLNPLVWAAPVGGRVVREGIYSSLSLLLIALALRVWVERASQDPTEDFRAKRRALVALGIFGAAFWLTREEGLWLAPTLAIPAAYFAWHAWRNARNGAPLVASAAPLVLPVLVFAAAVGVVNATNWAVYGVFKNNDFRSHDFQAAYGALSRIAHDREEPYVLFPKDARLRAYSVSPAAAELRPFLDGAVGAAWARRSCEQRNKTGCAEIEAGLLMWALRQSVTEAGHYRSATEARDFYLRLAREVNDGCDQGRIPCGPERATMIPPWRPEYLAQTVSAVRDAVVMLVTLVDGQPHALGSIGTPEHIAYFRKMTAGPIATETVRDARNVRQHLATAAYRVEIWLLPFALPASLLAWAAIGLWRPRLFATPAGLVVAMLVAALAMRVGLLAFLDATSMPSINILYLSPAVPMLLALAPCVVLLGWSQRPRASRNLESVFSLFKRKRPAALAPAPQPEPPEVPRYHSKFGGLWIDRLDAEQELSRRLASGEVSSDMGRSIAKFIEDGYLIIPGAVAPEVADRIAATIANAFEHGDERLRYQGLTQEIFKLEGKSDPFQKRIIESHAVLPEVREAFAAPSIVAFLEAIFGEPAVLAQSIIFQVGSEQPLHRDTTYVRFESPLSMVGCWIALEDVRVGSGALSYVVGSHRMPDFPYSNGKKDGMEVPPDELHRSLMWVVEESDNRGLSKQLFHPKKGDALIWHADLAHGGSPITDTQLTRRSLVGHLCPLSVRRSDQPPTTPRRQHGPIQYSSMYYDLS